MDLKTLDKIAEREKLLDFLKSWSFEGHDIQSIKNKEALLVDLIWDIRRVLKECSKKQS